MRRATLLGTLGALSLAPIAGTAQPARTLIRVGAGPDDQSTPLLYAAKYGLYARAGINVEVVRLAGAAAVAAALSGGSLEIGKASSLSVITAVGRGLPFTVIGNLAYYNSARPDTALLVGVSSGIRVPKDLEGKTLGAVSLQDMNSIGTFAWLEQYGVDRSTLRYVELPSSASLAAMEQGRIVGSTILEPFLSTFLATGKVRILGFPFDAIGKHFSQGLLFTTKSWAADHRDDIARFLRATDEGARFIAAHDDVSNQLSAEFGGVDLSTVPNLRHAERGIPLNAAEIQPVIDTAAKYQVIAKSFSAADMLCSCALVRK
jgi:NitT/TauT family transport system substrate-binding protein